MQLSITKSSKSKMILMRMYLRVAHYFSRVHEERAKRSRLEKDIRYLRRLGDLAEKSGHRGYSRRTVRYGKRDAHLNHVEDYLP